MDSTTPKRKGNFSPLTKADLTGGTLLVVVNLLLLYLFFGNLVFRLNQVSFAKDGDGLKGYYASMYHIQHDTAYVWFDGMNYPFGEHVFFTDSQPLITNTVKWISHHWVDISGYSVGIINLLMLLSLWLGAFFIYLIFRKFGVGWLVSLLAATFIIWLSPQLSRISGHFALSYLSHLPGMLLFLLLFLEKPNLWRSSIVAVWLLLISLTHFYFFGIAAVLLLLFWLFAFVKKEIVPLPLYSRILHLLLQLVLPLVLIQLFTYFTDPVTDRPSVPWGFMFYRAYPESVFLPVRRPYAPFLSNIINVNHVTYEGFAYAGLAVTMFFTGTIFYLLCKLVTGKWHRLVNLFGNPLYNLLFWTALLALLYSFAVPFVFNMEWLLIHLGPLRQMRGVGRFAWLFYYLMNILLVVLLYRKILEKRRTVLFSTILGAVIISLGFEAYFNANHLKPVIDNPNPFTTESWVEIPPDKYQVIIPMPYFHVGSENFWRDAKSGMMPVIFDLSLQNGIPTSGVFLSRTSLSQTLMQMEPFLELNADPPVLDLYDDRDVLILWATDQPMQPWQTALLSKAIHLARKDDLLLTAMPVNLLKEMLAYPKMTPGINLKEVAFVDSVYFQDIRANNNVLFESDLLANAIPGECFVSFDVSQFAEDLVPRTSVNIVLIDNSNTVFYEKWYGLGDFLCGFSGQTGSFRIPLTLPDNAWKVVLKVTSKERPKSPMLATNIRLIHQLTATEPEETEPEE